MAQKICLCLLFVMLAGCNNEQKNTTPEPAQNPPAAAPVQPQPQTPAAPAVQPQPAPAKPRVELTTSKGKILIELDPAQAPVTVENFVTYVKAGFYNGTIFHRVIPGFMIQGGGFAPDMTEKATRPPIVNESKNGLKNNRGTIAMARKPDPDSATAQFFINVNDNAALNWPSNGGYTVFGKVIEGMDVADAIVSVPTTRKGMYDNVPVTPIVIEQARIVE